jgi:transposase, IS5 family
VSTKQLSLTEFESPFERNLNPSNRWVILSKLLPWDELCSIYWKYVSEKSTGRTPLNPRIVYERLLLNIYAI